MTRFASRSRFTTIASRPTAASPPGRWRQLVSKVVGTPLPDILYDGMVNPRKLSGGCLPADLAIRIRNNGDAGFANFDLAGPRT